MKALEERLANRRKKLEQEIDQDRERESGEIDKAIDEEKALKL